VTNPTKTLMPPILFFGEQLSAAGAAGDQIIHDVSGALSFYVLSLNGVYGDVTIQLGDESAPFPILSGMFLRTSGFRRVRVANLSIATRTLQIMFSADPNFFVMTGRITG